eukprot:Skav228313  [mRNA]  locus=scaffold3685:6311:9463:- [translate_table: standard]
MWRQPVQRHRAASKLRAAAGQRAESASAASPCGVAASPGVRHHAASTRRLKMLLFTYIARAAIASLLLGAGVRWLAGTTSITDLMLNAVALNAILDVDEFLFAGFTPISIQVAVQNLEPVKMKYSRRRSQFESFGLLILLAGTLLGPYFFLLQPLAETMIAVKLELSPPVIATSSPGSEVPYLISFAPTSVIFDSYLNRDIGSEVAQWGLCIEAESLGSQGAQTARGG